MLIMAAAITRDKDRSIRAMMNNIKMDSNIANLLAEYPPSHLIYISSIDVYGGKSYFAIRRGSNYNLLITMLYQKCAENLFSRLHVRKIIYLYCITFNSPLCPAIP